MFVHLHDTYCMIGFMAAEIHAHRSARMSECAAAADMTGGAAVVCVYKKNKNRTKQRNKNKLSLYRRSCDHFTLHWRLLLLLLR